MSISAWASVKRVLLDYTQFTNCLGGHLYHQNNSNSSNNNKHKHSSGIKKKHSSANDQKKGHQYHYYYHHNHSASRSKKGAAGGSKRTSNALSSTRSVSTASTTTYSKSVDDSYAKETFEHDDPIQNKATLSNTADRSNKSGKTNVTKAEMGRYSLSRSRGPLGSELKASSSSQLVERIPPHEEAMTSLASRKVRSHGSHRYNRHASKDLCPEDDRQPTGIPREIVVERQEVEQEEESSMYLNHEGIPWIISVPTDGDTTASTLSLPRELRVKSTLQSPSEEASSIEWPSDEDGPIFQCNGFRFWTDAEKQNSTDNKQASKAR